MMEIQMMEMDARLTAQFQNVVTAQMMTEMVLPIVRILVATRMETL